VLITFFVEVESIINAHPLTPVSFVDALDRPLTSNDLLFMSGKKGHPPTLSDKSDGSQVVSAMFNFLQFYFGNVGSKNTYHL